MLRRAHKTADAALPTVKNARPADFAVTNAIREPQADTPDHPGEPIR
ncbi:hypothetical protein HAT91_04134 [Dickeya solani]|nr:hypothetical protein HAT91_04134 [Dickeya solani]